MPSMTEGSLGESKTIGVLTIFIMVTDKDKCIYNFKCLIY